MKEVPIVQIVERIESALSRLDKSIPATVEQRGRDRHLRVLVEDALGEIDALLARRDT